MRSFLVKDKVPICKWGMLPENTFYEGKVPEGYKLALSPGENYIVIDVDVDTEKSKNGFNNIPKDIFKELFHTYFYDTKRGGRHYWLKYTGELNLPNKASNLDIDLRVGSKGYVVYYPYINEDDIRNHLHEIIETSPELNKWLEKTFYYVNNE
jgi:hypothetical protein